jgi:excisionase family DNA binding protein
MDKLVFSRTETAYVLDTTEDTINDLIANRQLPYRRIGRRVVIPVKELERWIEALPGLKLKEILEAGGTVQPPEPSSITERSTAPALFKQLTLKKGPRRPPFPYPAQET